MPAEYGERKRKKKKALLSSRAKEGWGALLTAVAAEQSRKKRLREKEKKRNRVVSTSILFAVKKGREEGGERRRHRLCLVYRIASQEGEKNGEGSACVFRLYLRRGRKVSWSGSRAGSPKGNEKKKREFSDGGKKQPLQNKKLPEKKISLIHGFSGPDLGG